MTKLIPAIILLLFCLSVFAQTTNLEGYTLLKPDRVGVFAHGDNALEMILMAKYGMKPLDVLRSATSINAAVFRLKDLGNIKVLSCGSGCCKWESN